MSPEPYALVSRYRLAQYRGARRIRIAPGTVTDSLASARRSLEAAKRKYPNGDHQIEVHLDGVWERYS